MRPLFYLLPLCVLFFFSNLHGQITPATLENGTVGLPYVSGNSSPNPSVRFNCAAAVGVRNAVWSMTVTPARPPLGLTLSRQGVLSGKPQNKGNYTLNIVVKSGRDVLCTATRNLTILETAPPTISGSFLLPDGIWDKPYVPDKRNNGHQLSASGGTPFLPNSTYPNGYFWQFIPGKQLFQKLPPGMTFNSRGVLSGTPVWPKCPFPSGNLTYSLTFRATDFLGKNATATFSLVIQPPLPPKIESACPLPDGTELLKYPLVQLKASGGKPPYAWSMISGELPKGLSFSSKGYISGTPAKDPRNKFTYKFRLKVTDRNCLSEEKDCEITIFPALTCNQTIAIPCLYNGLNLPDTVAFNATGGKPPYEWTLYPVGFGKMLPGGLLQKKPDGSILYGTITENGTFKFRATVKDSLGNTCSQNHTIVVHPKLENTTVCPLDKGKIGISYSDNLTAKGGKLPYSWELVPPNTGLPSGLVLNPVTGVISGTPTESGNFTFSYKIKDSCNQELLGNCSIRISKECECILETIENGSSLGIALDTSGSTSSRDVLVNGVTKSRRDAFNQILSDYGLGSHPNRYDEPGSSTQILDSMISNAIKSLGKGSKELNIIVLNDSQDVGLSNWGLSNAAYASVANSNLKINVYYIRVAGSAIQPAILSELTSFINSKPAYINKFYQNSFTQYNTGDASELNDILTEAFSSRYRCSDKFGNEVFVSTKDAKSVEEAENLICNPKTITPETEINIWFDASGSMSEVFSVLEKMQSEVLKPCLVQFFNGNGTLFDQRVKVLKYYDERAFSVLNTQGSTSAITKVINLAFSDEAMSNYHSHPFDSLTRTSVYESDIAALRGTLLSKPSYIHGAVFRIIGVDPFLDFMDAVIGGTAAYAGNYGLVDQNDIRIVRNVARPSGGVGIATPLPGSPMYYGNQIISALNSMGFSLKLCDQAQDSPVSLTPIIVSQNPLEGPAVGVPYQGIISAVGGALPYTWGLPNGSVPTGLTLNAATGVIEGIPTSAETANFTISVTDSNNSSDQKGFSLTVQLPLLAVEWSEDTPVIPVGEPAGLETFTASGGDGNYTWSISDGNLPPGIVLSNNSGSSVYLSGTPTIPGIYNFRIRVSSGDSFSDIDVTYIVESGTGPTPTPGPSPTPSPANMLDVIGGTLPETSELAGTVVETFLIGKYEVTWAEWQEVRDWAVLNGYTDLDGVGEGSAADHPVREVSWYDVVKWCNAASEKDGLTPVYIVGGVVYRTGESAPTVDGVAGGYRLPTEAEWEWAARGGGSSQGYIYSGSNDLNEVGWYGENSGGAVVEIVGTNGTWPVGEKAANELGLYDMSGNVAEWCLEENTASGRRMRGGGFFNQSLFCEVAYRHTSGIATREPHFGFRLARNTLPATQMIEVTGGTLPQTSALAGTSVSDFQIGKYEVTWDEWLEVRNWAVNNGYSDLAVGNGTQRNHPVQMVSWYDVLKWCNAKSERAGLSPVYIANATIYRSGQFGPDGSGAITINSGASGYRLPTEAEWEWAARGGVNSGNFTYSGSNDVDEVAWHSGIGTKAVGSKLANELGTFDMSGNVWEWVWDENMQSGGGGRVLLLGGSYSAGAGSCAIGVRRPHFIGRFEIFVI